MVKARSLDKRRKSIRNIRKITRTMELIATARFKKTMDRATAASAFTQRITKLVRDLAATGLPVSHPLMEVRESPERAILLVLTSNRGMCGGYNASVIRMAVRQVEQLGGQLPTLEVEVSGKRGNSAFRYRKIPVSQFFTHFEDKPRFEEVDLLATRYLDDYAAGRLDRLDIAYMKFESASRQVPMIETLLPFQAPQGFGEPTRASTAASLYEFLPSAAEILQEVVPASFKTRLFKCFLDAAVSEQIARMVAMKAATENAGELIRQLSINYNRARQGQITGEIMEIIGGVEALKG
jgi:F-type H+-transporting ATPase subunit gamma